MRDLRVIAVGSPFAGDDIAWQVSDQLQPQFDKIEFVKLDRPGSQLLDYLKDMDVVIVMDALQNEVAEGVKVLSLQQLEQETQLVSSHGFGVAEALQLAEAMQALPERVRIIGLSSSLDISRLAEKCAVLLEQLLASNDQNQEMLDVV